MQMAAYNLTPGSRRQKIPESTAYGSQYTLLSTPVEFGQQISHTIPKENDVVHSFYAHVRIGALPAGVEWKPHLFARLIRSAKLEVGGQTICTLKGEELMMKLHTGLLQLPNEIPVHDRLVANRPSTSAQEFCIPLFLKDEIGLSCVMIALNYHIVRIHLEFATLSELILPSSGGAPALPLQPPSLTCTLRATGECYYSTMTRREIALKDQAQSIFTFESDTILADLEHTDYMAKIRVHGNSIVTTCILHITDEHGLEIPYDCVDQITVEYNGDTNRSLSGYEGKYMQRTQIPWHVKETPTSENIYFLSYWIARQFSDGDPRRPIGSDFGRIDSIVYKVKFHSNAPSRVRITLAHDAQNIFRMIHGMGGNQYLQGYSIEDMNVIALPGAALQTIYVEEGEVCMIEQEALLAGEIVYQCGQCKKPCRLDPMKKWFQLENTNCPHCRTEVKGILRKGPVVFGPDPAAATAPS